MSLSPSRVTHCSASSTTLGSLSSSLTSKSFPSGRRSSSVGDVYLLPLLPLVVLLLVVFYRRWRPRSISNPCNTIVENGNENKYENDDKHELSSLLLVPIDDAQNVKKSRRSKCFVALLLVVSATAMAAAMTVLVNGFSSAGVHPIASAFSSVMGTRRTQGQSCDSPWWDACGDKLSCFDSGSFGRYCVPSGKENACCGYLEDDVASGINCLSGLSCDHRTEHQFGTVSTCHRRNLGAYGSFAAKGSCNVNTGEPATIFIECTFTDEE